MHANEALTLLVISNILNFNSILLHFYVRANRIFRKSTIDLFITKDKFKGPLQELTLKAAYTTEKIGYEANIFVWEDYAYPFFYFLFITPFTVH